MNLFTKIAVIACAAGFAPGSACAELIGLRVFREGLYGNPEPSNTPLWIYRVYAEFTVGSDSVYAWGVGNTLGAGQIVNITEAGTPGSGFTNIPDNDTGNLAPHNPLTPRDWDTYMTLGLLYGSTGPGGIDGSVVFPGTPTFISNATTGWSSSQDAGVVLSSLSSPQGRADFWIYGNDTDRRVMLMQLVVNAGEHVAGTIGVAWRQPQSGVLIEVGLSFSSVPAPSVLCSFLLASTLTLRRRARNSAITERRNRGIASRASTPRKPTGDRLHLCSRRS